MRFDPVECGKRMKALRESKNLTQMQLAELLDITNQAVSKWESEQSTPDIEKIIIMSELFEVTTDYILKGIEPVSMTNKKNNVFSVFGICANICNHSGNLVFYSK